jgi:two-component system sensor histidine kinase KdpD
MRVRGVLALQPAQARWLLIPEQVQQLDTLARQIAIALERVHYVDIAQQAVVEMESERLRNALLAAISHDVRTPLTALIGLAESLQQSVPPLPAAQAGMAQALNEQARALNALVNNLLDMARLQSGVVNLRMEWQSVEEMVGSAIRAAQHVLGGKRGHGAVAGGSASGGVRRRADRTRAGQPAGERRASYGASPVEMGAEVTPMPWSSPCATTGQACRWPAGPRTHLVRQVHARRGGVFYPRCGSGPGDLQGGGGRASR